MKIIDLSHPITSDMPVYPGDGSPVFTLESDRASSGYQVSRISLNSHTGTHLDAPAHLLTDSRLIQDYPLSDFIGRGKVLDCSDQTEIGERWLQDALMHPTPEFILFHTHTSRYWGEDRYFHSYPVFSKKAAELLAKYPLKGIGIDAPSFDGPSSASYNNHIQFLGNGILLIENLCNLNCLLNNEFVFSCVPLPLPVSDGSPVRAFAIINEYYKNESSESRERSPGNGST